MRMISKKVDSLNDDPAPFSQVTFEEIEIMRSESGHRSPPTGDQYSQPPSDCFENFRL